MTYRPRSTHSLLLYALVLSCSVSNFCAFKLTGQSCRSLTALRASLEIEIDGATISYDLLRGEEGSSEAPLVYLPGLVNTVGGRKTDAKSINLRGLAKQTATTFLCADYFGVGLSSGNFDDACVSRWRDDTICILDDVLNKGNGMNKKGAILVGHGMGSWIALLVAKKRPDLVGGIVGLSSDPDFTELLLWKTLSSGDKAKIMQGGAHEITWGSETYHITKKLIEDGRENLLMSGVSGSVEVHCPVRLIHAINDEEVPFQLALDLADRLASTDVNVQLLKGEGAAHAMEGDMAFQAMRAMIADVRSEMKRGPSWFSKKNLPTQGSTLWA